MNGAGRKTSPTFGFGLLDANEFVNIAEQWPGQIPERDLDANRTWTLIGR